MTTLFDNEENHKPKKIGNPYHRSNGRFSNKYVARAELAEKASRYCREQSQVHHIGV